MCVFLFLFFSFFFGLFLLSTTLFLFKIILCLKEAVCHRLSLILLPEEPELKAMEMNRVCRDNCGR